MPTPASLANLRPPWKPGECGRGHVQPITTALRALFELADESGKTNLARFAEYALRRCADGGKHEHLWARLVLEYAYGKPREQVDVQVGLGPLLAQAHERWMAKRDETQATQES